ncbi:MAG: hypothetical protein ACRDRZ_00825 [Pseudonocardiaceae bacterium]
MTEDPRDPHGPLLAVTTRSRLRSVRFFPAMLVGTLHIRRQLARTDGVVRWASLIAGPTEFWTITVWRSRHAMQEFTRSDEHGKIMWRFSRWLHSLWLMRWRPGPYELGSWAGLSLAPPHDSAASRPPTPEWPALPGALENLPELQSAIGADGVASYDSSSRVRRDRRRVEGAAGVVIRIHAPRRRFPTALLELVRLRRSVGREPSLLRSVVGVGKPGEVYFLSVFRAHPDATRFLEGSRVGAASQRWGDGFWAGAWLPENEFGHWDGLRIRRALRRPDQPAA